MLQRLLYGNGTEFRFRRLQKGAARSGEPDAPNLLYLPSPQALVDCIVFTIDGEQRPSLPAGLGSYQFARDHQAFLVGQANGLTSAHGLVSGFQPRYANISADHEIPSGMRSNPNRSCGPIYPSDVLHPASLEP